MLIHTCIIKANEPWTFQLNFKDMYCIGLVQTLFKRYQGPSLHSMYVCRCSGLDSLSQAREYLTKAEWAVMNTPDCNPIVLQLHRTLGRLHAATGKYSSALFHFSSDVSPRVC